MKITAVILLGFITSVFNCTSAKVVVFFPMPGASHIRYHTNIARAVVELGHQAWVCIPNYLAKTTKIDTSGIKVLSYGETLGNIEDNLISKTGVQDDFWENKTSMSMTQIFKIMKEADNIMWGIITDGLAERVKIVNADLFVIDGLPFTRYIYTVPYKLGIPYAVVGTVFDATGYRIPFSPVATPSQLRPANDRVDSFLSRLQNVMSSSVLMVIPFIMDSDPVSTFAPEKPHKTVSDLIANAEVYICELDPIMDYPRPTLPNVKLIGGTAAKEAKALQEPFKSFMDGSKNGVILITFGSMLLNIPDYIFIKIKTACEQSGLNVVWRSDQDSPDPKRFLTSKWVPQNDILGHRNTKLFISHCGKNGQYESLYHGVPILCLPVFGDQLYNAERVTIKGYGMKEDMRFATSEQLSHKVKQLVTNSSYQDNILKASRLFRLMYKSPMKESAFWLDHVMEYGGEYMRAATQRMPYYQFLMLDVIGIAILGTWITGFVTMYCLLVVCRRRGNASPKQKSKSKSE